jgi:hypothetical protein
MSLPPLLYAILVLVLGVLSFNVKQLDDSDRKFVLFLVRCGRSSRS